MKLAITTPTGNIGRKLVKMLQDRGDHELVLLARDASKLAEEQSRGAEVREGDMENPEYLAQATKGVDALFLAIPPRLDTADFEAHHEAIAKYAADAIATNKIPHTVLISSIGAHIGHGVGPVNAFKSVESILSDAADGLTILRPTFFMENMMMTLDGVASAGSVFLPIDGETEFPMIATADVAAAAAESLTRPDVSGVEVRSLHGPKDYSFVEVSDAIGEAIGREVSFVRTKPEQTREALKGMGVNEHVADLYIEMYDAMESGHMQDNVPRSEQTTTPTTFEHFAKTTIAPALQKQ